MREILFRGKSLDNGEWVEGAFCMKDCDDPFGELKDNPSIIKYGPPFDGFWFRVNPETVGQFTGLTDKNGQKIFEGDILQYFDDEIQVVEWDDGFARIMLHTYGERERKQGRKVIKVKHDGWNDMVDYPLEKMSILGNIYDNPELLEGRTEDGKK